MLNNTEVKKQSNVTYLGYVFNEYENYKSHCKEISQKYRKCVNGAIA